MLTKYLCRVLHFHLCCCWVFKRNLIWSQNPICTKLEDRHVFFSMQLWKYLKKGKLYLEKRYICISKVFLSFQYNIFLQILGYVILASPWLSPKKLLMEKYFFDLKLFQTWYKIEYYNSLKHFWNYLRIEDYEPYAWFGIFNLHSKMSFCCSLYISKNHKRPWKRRNSKRM